MAKRALLGAYIYRGEIYGPGEVELPKNSDKFVAVIDAGEKRQQQRLSERMASSGIDPTTFGLPEVQLVDATPDVSPVTVPVVENAPVVGDASGGDGGSSAQSAEK